MLFTVCANSPALFALIDGNNFFVSCERVFNPSLNNKPVIVLSSNDGCAIARSNEAKALKIPMGAPLHTFSHLIKPQGIKILSCNFELYGDFSNRMMNILKTFTPDVEVYSIDEAFLDLSHLPIKDYTTFAQSLYDTLLKYIGIPITIGIASTKTLAKVANRIAKKQRMTNLTLNTPEITNKALAATNIGDVWGIGRALEPKLKLYGIYTAYDMAQKDPKWARNKMTVAGERLVRELQGIACIHFNKEESDRQNIQVTRSFGVRLSEFDDIAEAISAHATRLGEQLRKRTLLTPTLSVFCKASPFSKASYYKGIGIVGFDAPTNDTRILIKGAIQALRQAYQAGHSFQSAGIHAMNLTKEGAVIQKQLFNETSHQTISFISRHKQAKTLNQAIDTVNKKQGKDALFWASNGIKPRYHVKQNQRSPRYTTRWDELLLVG